MVEASSKRGALGKNVFDLTLDIQAITSFVKAAGTPLVIEFLRELHAGYVAVSLHRHNQSVPRTDYALLAGLPPGYVFAEAAEVRALLSETGYSTSGIPI
jgi:hypothetical protein